MFTTVLVANRGEIALRVIRTLDELAVASVAVFTDEDAESPHVRAAGSAVRIGSYLDADALVAAALETGAQAVHPGYGFLAEQASFARACAAAGLVLVGPSAQAMETMGDKIAARAAVAARGVATVPGLAGRDLDDAALIARAGQVGFPLLVKPAAGGGGKGMHRVDRAQDLPAALVTARREAAAAFGDDTLLLERFVPAPRHVEVQVLADAHGTVVHLGERECSLQRRHQKVVEEAPSPLLSPRRRERLGRLAVATARAVDYVGAGTVEFIVSADAPDEPFFIEMNTRLQVEHPVTEAVTGIDLVAEQVRLAAGLPLGFTQEEVRRDGHAVEARVYAEDPDAGFVPTGGTVLDLSLPTGVRVDHALRVGADVSSAYDPLLAKVVAHAPTRAEALARLDRALAATHVLGVVTNTVFLRRLLADEDVAAGRLDTGLIERRRAALTRPGPSAREYAVAALVRWQELSERAPRGPWHAPTGWRLGAPAPFVVRFAGPSGDPVVVSLTGSPDRARARVGGVELALVLHPDAVTVDGRRRPLRRCTTPGAVWLGTTDGDRELRLHTRSPASGRGAQVHSLDSPMPGVVVAVLVADGADVRPGDPVLTVEAMKMEHVLRAPTDGAVHLHVATGQTVRRGDRLAQVVPTKGGDDG